MTPKRIPQPQSIRAIGKSFAWLDHRLLRNGFLKVMTLPEHSLYLFLVLAADRDGVSFYRQEKICDALGLGFSEFRQIRRRLIDLNLIAFAPYHDHTPNGYYQVLPVPDTIPKGIDGLFTGTSGFPARLS
jgi:hypothetical protein